MAVIQLTYLSTKNGETRKLPPVFHNAIRDNLHINVLPELYQQHLSRMVNSILKEVCEIQSVDPSGCDSEIETALMESYHAIHKNGIAETRASNLLIDGNLLATIEFSDGDWSDQNIIQINYPFNEKEIRCFDVEDRKIFQFRYGEDSELPIDSTLRLLDVSFDDVFNERSNHIPEMLNHKILSDSFLEVLLLINNAPEIEASVQVEPVNVEQVMN